MKLLGRDRIKVFARHQVKLCTADPRPRAPATGGRIIKLPDEISDGAQHDQLEDGVRPPVECTKW